MAAAMKATRTMSGSTPSRSPRPAQTPPRIRRLGSRRSGGVPPVAVAEPLAIVPSMLRAPAQAEGDENRPHRGEGDGGEGRESEVDRVGPVEQQDNADRGEGEAPDQRWQVRATHSRSPRSGPALRG